MIETARLLLRPHGIGDLEAYVPLWQPEPGVEGLPVLGEEEAWARLLRWIGHWSVFGFGPFVVWDRQSGLLCGEVGFGYFNRGHGPQFDDVPEGMWKIDRAYRGRGYAREALEAAVGWLDRNVDVQRSVCMIDPSNGPSRQLAARIGFRQYAMGDYKGNPLVLYERLRRA